MSMTQDNDRRLLPWSYRQPMPVRLLIDVLSGAAIGASARWHIVWGIDEHPIWPGIGLSHRNPFHLVRPLTRRRRRACPALISSSLVVWTGHGGIRPGGDALIPVGFGSDANMPFFSDHAGYFWLYGIVLIPCIMLLLPKRWFVVQPRTDTDAQPME